uniref:C2H2-type domain-containing protein n=1 Tax=Sinocyclocheilus grahami TaxID=75366 RepID=A0A672L1I5_SINGR
MCLKSFRYRWHLQCHVRIHKKKGQNIIAGHLEQDCTVSFSNAAKSEKQDVQIPSQDGAENSAKVHKNQNMLHIYTYPSKHSEGQWMEENQGSEHGQEASVTTQSKDKDVNAKVSQSKNFNGSKRVYDCPVCHKQFGAPSKLKRHCLIHTNQRPFQVYDCPVCHKRFGAPSELKRHCLIHTNQRPFQCSICCRAFREHSPLKVHIRTHTNPMKRRTRSLHSYKDNSVHCLTHTNQR